jgi:hypothetical protein
VQLSAASTGELIRFSTTDVLPPVSLSRWCYYTYAYLLPGIVSWRGINFKFVSSIHALFETRMPSAWKKRRRMDAFQHRINTHFLLDAPPDLALRVPANPLLSRETFYWLSCASENQSSGRGRLKMPTRGDPDQIHHPFPSVPCHPT